MVPRQVAFQFPGNPSRNGAQLPVRLQGLGAVLRMVAEALVPVNPLEDESVALAQRKTQGFHDGQHFADNLFMQLRVRGVSHVLFLHGGVDEGHPVMVTVIVFLVDTDALRQNQFHALLADTLAEMHQFARIAGKGWRELKHPAKILEISVLAPLLHHRFIRQVAHVLKNQKAAHQTDRLCRTPVVRTV